MPRQNSAQGLWGLRDLSDGFKTGHATIPYVIGAILSTICALHVSTASIFVDGFCCLLLELEGLNHLNGA